MKTLKRIGLVLIGVVLGAGFYNLPHEPHAYLVTAKERCLTPDGIEWTMSYAGRGDVQFHVVPPTPAEPEKEKKK